MKGCSAVGLWESEGIWIYPAFKDGIKEKCSRIRQILGVIALVRNMINQRSLLHPIVRMFGCATPKHGIDLRNFKLKKRCPNHNYKRWKIVTQCSKYRTTAETMWILSNSSKTKPTPPVFSTTPDKLPTSPIENSSPPTIFQLLYETSGVCSCC